MNIGQKNHLPKENFLRFNTTNFKKKYKVEVIFEETVYNRNRIVYDASVENLEVDSSGNFLCYVTLKNFLVNNNEPDLIMEQIAYKCRKPFETLVLIIARNGEIIGINNHPDILERWAVVKERLAIEYSGKEFEKYIGLVNEAIINPEVFLSKLKQDIFISQFFYPIYNEAFINFSKKNIEKIKFFNINYQVDTILEIQSEGELNNDDRLILKKVINKREYKFSEMPIEFFETEYVLNRDMEIVKVKGRFENHGRKCIYNILES